MTVMTVLVLQMEMLQQIIVVHVMLMVITIVYRIVLVHGVELLGRVIVVV